MDPMMLVMEAHMFVPAVTDLTSFLEAQAIAFAAVEGDPPDPPDEGDGPYAPVILPLQRGSFAPSAA